MAARGAADDTRVDREHFHSKGPYNLIALVPVKVAKKILDLEFVEKFFSSDDPTPSAPGHPPPRGPIKDISRWVEKFSITAAILSTRYHLS